MIDRENITDKKVIVVTGGLGLIGLEISKHLLGDGYKVVIIDKNDTKFNSEFDNQDNIFFFKSDITSKKSINNVFDQIIERFSEVHSVIHCSYPKTSDWGTRFENLEENSLQQNLFSQLGSSILLAQKVMKIFTNQKKGNLILFSSILGLRAPKFDQYKDTKMVSPIEYSAVKSGIVSITKYLAKY